MGAGHESCSCPVCETVCTGRFTGCTLVWVAEGKILVDRPAPLALGSGPVSMFDQPHATNGRSALVEGALLLDERPVQSGPLSPLPPHAGTELLSSDEPDLFDEGAGPHSGGDETSSAVEPGLGAESLRALIGDLIREVRRLSERVERLAGAQASPPPDAVLVQVDARFEWLTNQLSERLVVLGNEIVAIKRHLTAGGASSNGP